MKVRRAEFLLFSGLLFRGSGRSVALSSLSFGGRFRVFIVTVFDDVLHDERNTAVGWIKRRFGFAQLLVSEAADLRDLVGPDSATLHQPASGVGAVGREFPVAVVR